MKHLLKLQDLDKNEILDILNLADQLKYENHNGIEHHHLKGKTLGMIFQKSSTRTRVEICKSAEASRCRTQQEYFHATLTVL